MKVLAGDIGGTKTLLLSAEVDGGSIEPLTERRYESAAYPGLAPMVRSFLDTTGESAASLARACFAVAGPVSDQDGRQVSRITNLPWELDSSRLAAELGLGRVRLINDFQGVGYGIEALGPDDLAELQAGTPHPRAPRAVIGAGTGLGQALSIWQQDHYEVYPTEGGHVDFAPVDETQIALLRYLRHELARVSVERIVSGAGLVRIYSFLRDRADGQESAALRQAMRQGDPAAAISTFALTDRDALAAEALTLFVRIYGAQAGNLALSTLCRGGLYLAGGIAPKILERLRGGDFLDAFRAKGRMAPLLETIPVRVILNARVGLWGAALAGARL